MSTSFTPSADAALWLDAVPLHLPPETLKQRLASLIRDAVGQGSASVAETVVRHFQALYLHPGLQADDDERAAYCRGARHWRQLAATQPLAEQAPRRLRGQPSRRGGQVRAQEAGPLSAQPLLQPVMIGGAHGQV